MKYALLLLALLLPACASTETEALRQFTVEDLEAAKALAADDPLALPCWSLLADKLRELPEPGANEVKGVASAIQAARNTRRKVQSGISDEAKIACAPMIMDGVTSYSRLATMLRAGL